MAPSVTVRVGGEQATATYTVTSPAHPIPANAVYFGPSGNDNNPGTASSPRATAKVGAFNVQQAGVLTGYSQTLPNGTVTTILVPDGTTAIMDGGGTVKTALTAGGTLNLYGPGVVRNYAPTASTGISCVAVYYGGTAAGSEIDGWSITGSKQAALGFQVPLKFTTLTVTDCGYAGLLGTTADGTKFGNVRVLRINRNAVAQDGQMGAIKVTRSADLSFTKGVYVEDTGGATGLWVDVSCQRPTFARCQVRTGAGKAAGIGLLLEETEGGIIAGCTIEGVYGLSAQATGHLRVWNNTIAATSVGVTIGQDRAGNSGSTPANLDPKTVPWMCVGNEINGNKISASGGYNIALTTLTKGAGLGLVTTPQMLASLKGNTYTGTVQLETSPAGHRDTMTAAQLASYLGSTYSATTPATPADIAALMN